MGEHLSLLRPDKLAGTRPSDPFFAATLDLLRRGDTLGVNQLESPAMRHLLIQLRPRGVEDVAQALALIRPAAASVGAKETFVRRRRGLELVRCFHPRLAAVLDDTEGLMLYEDDALRVLQTLAGMTASEADHFRKAISKHRTEAEARALAEKFLAACAARGVSRAAAEEVWGQLAKFNQYSFCKSHAVSYGLIAWKAAALKAHYPGPFWTAALNNNQGMYPRRVYVEAAKRAGIPFRLPCANRSADTFTWEGDAIRVGLGAVATLSEELRAAILGERQRGGPYRDLADFRRRVRPGPEALAVLTRAGALDFTGLPRPALFLEADLQDRAGGPAEELFGHDPVPDWSPADYPARRRLRDEWDLLGFVVGPPLMALFRPGLPEGLATSRDLAARRGRCVQLAGLTATARQTPTVDGRTMQFVTLEDEWGLIEVTLFPGTCPPLPRLRLGPYLVSGTVEDQYGVCTVTAERFELAELDAGARPAVAPRAAG